MPGILKRRLRPGTISKEFTADYDAYYPMSVRFNRRTPAVIALCSLGAKGPTLDCSTTPPLLKFSWEFTQGGRSISSGTTANLELRHENDGALIAGPFGGLSAERKQSYTVVIKFDEDATALQIPPPLIRLDMASFKQMDFFIVGTFLDVLGLALCATGLLMLLYPILKARVGLSKANSAA